MLEQWHDGSLGPLPPAVAATLQRLAACGIAAYVVGGAVRNRLLGYPAGDWDIAAAADVKTLAHCLGRATGPGLAYGTIALGKHLQVTAMRREGAYSDGRRPDRVEFGVDLAADLYRRDFTVNAVAWDGGQRLWAVAGARDDFAARRLRAVGDAAARLQEDDLRVVRLARLAAEYELRIDAATFDAAWRVGVQRAARERRLQELLRIVVLPPTRWTVLGGLGLWDAYQLPRRWPRLPPAPVRGRRLSPAVGLFLLLRGFGLRGADGRAWVASWPLPRTLARPLDRGFAADAPGTPLVDPAWAIKARRHGDPQAPFWQQLAGEALGLPEAAIQPVRPVLDIADLKARGLAGARLGEAWRALCEHVARHPHANRRPALDRWLDAYLAGGE